jgi:CIC family chloride channel protein
MWIGGSGGVFAPSLFMGAMLGSAYGIAVHHLMPHLAAAAGAYGLVGMGAVFAAAARAPITGLLIIFELTGDYRIILPLMFAIVVATALSGALTRDTIYTLKLRRRGIDIEAAPPGAAAAMARTRVGDAMGAPPAPVAADEPLERIVDRFAAERSDSIPVIDANGTLVGVVTAADLEQALAAGSGAGLTAEALAREAPKLHRGDSLQAAALALGGSDEDGIPVVAEGDGRMIGWLTHRRLLRAYRDAHHKIPGAPAPAAGAPGGPASNSAGTASDSAGPGSNSAGPASNSARGG